MCRHFQRKNLWYMNTERTHLAHAGLNHPSLATRDIDIALDISGLIEPDLFEAIVNGTAYYLYFRERALQHGNAAGSSNEQRAEYDILLAHTVIEQDANGHERACARADLLQAV